MRDFGFGGQVLQYNFGKTMGSSLAMQYYKRCDNANEMLTFIPTNASTRNMTYDNNGNLTSVTNNCGTTTYTWNARNQLVGITGYRPDCSPLTASLKYDALGRRIEKTINGVTTLYLYDGFDIIQEKNASGAVTVNYIRTLNIDEPLTRIKSDGTIRHYVTDALGSVIALTDDTGAIKTTYTYDPFGNVTVSGESSDNPFQYTGRENDGTGLYYYRARYYSPDLQRFISEDPIGFEGGINLYVYVGSNPINRTDPLGLWYIDVNVSLGSWLGITVGVLINSKGIHPYVGGGIVTPGVGGSVTWSPFDPTSGWNVGLQGQAIVAGQVGYGFGEGGGWFWEGGLGAGYPTIAGGSLTGYYVFGPSQEKPKKPCK